MDPNDPHQRIQHTLLGAVVCPDHLEDDYLREWVSEHTAASRCDFCEREGGERFAAYLGDLAELVLDGLYRAWEDENEEVYWGMAYDGSRSTWELLQEAEVTEDPKLLDALVSGLPEHGWVQRNFYALTPAERLRYGWEHFVSLVKHHSRYFFGFAQADPDDPDDVSPSEVLQQIGTSAELAGLVDVWQDRDLFRARPRGPHEHFEHAWELAAVPLDQASKTLSNRMSAAGVPMFYGATDQATAVAETRSADSDSDPPVTAGRFAISTPLRILDLARPFEVPSLFDPANADDQAALGFLKDFVQELAKPVTRDDKEHVEYVPTQVVCEYLRSVFQTSDGLPLDGISYPSVQQAGGVCVVLFVANDEVQDADGERAPRARTLMTPVLEPDPAKLTLQESVALA